MMLSLGNLYLELKLNFPAEMGVETELELTLNLKQQSNLNLILMGRWQLEIGCARDEGGELEITAKGDDEDDSFRV